MRVSVYLRFACIRVPSKTKKVKVVDYRIERSPVAQGRQGVAGNRIVETEVSETPDIEWMIRLVGEISSENIEVNLG